MSELRWRHLRDLPGHDHGVFRTREVEAAHPETGAVHRYALVDTTDWVNVIAVTPAREVVCVRQWRPGTDRVHLEIPGGVIDPGEAPEGAAPRELEEETGYRATRWRRLGVLHPNPALSGNRLHTFLAEDATPTGAARPDDGEVLRVVLLPLAELTAAFRDGRLDHALVVAAFALAPELLTA